MKRFFLFALVATMFAACVTDETQDVAVELAPDTLTVSFEGDDSRIQLQNGKTVWTKGDLVSVFYRSNANQKWQYQGATGERTGNLKRVNAGNATETTSKVVVVYPYNEKYYINPETCDVEAFLPAQQTFLKDSYGLDGNIMISSGYYNQFSLKNVCGWLKVQLTGNGEKVKSIKLKGNNGEQVAGQIYINSATAEATLASEMGGADDTENGAGGNLVFDDTILTEVTLDCGDGATIFPVAKSFYIALPPQTFNNGISVLITTIDGREVYKYTSNKIVIERNIIQPMAVLDISGETLTIPSNQIWYTAAESLYVNEESFNSKIISHEYNTSSGEGIITFEDDLTTIGDNAFALSALQSITLPDSISSVGNFVFNGCRNLSYFYSKFASEDNHCLIVDGVLKGIALAGLEEYTLPDSITTIPDQGCAVMWFEDLKKLVCSNSITSMGNGAFEESYYIEEIILSDNFSSISNRAFSMCNSLKTINIPTDVKSIGDNAFSGCENLDGIMIGNGIATIGDWAFCNCSSLTNISLPDEVTSIGDSAFSSCTNLTSINIPSRVESIGNYAFADCRSLKDVYCVSTTPPILGDEAFSSSGVCKILVPSESIEAYKSAINWSNYVSIIESYNATPANNEIWYTTTDGQIVTPNEGSDFMESSSYEANIISNVYENGKGVITFDRNIDMIGYRAFSGCETLKSLRIPQGVTTIGPYAFSSCENLVSTSIPNSVTTIKSEIFYYCPELRRISIPDSVTSIGEDCFAGCVRLEAIYSKYSTVDNRCLIKDNILLGFAPAGLTEYSIPSSVTKIGYGAFKHFENLKRITIPESVKIISSDAFYKCNGLTTITIPANVTEIYIGAFESCASLKKIYCKPTTPPSIPEYYFPFPYYNSDLKIYVPIASIDIYKAAQGWKYNRSYLVGYDFDKNEVVTNEPENNQIFYSAQKKIYPKYDAFGTSISSMYWDSDTGDGYIYFHDNINLIGDEAFYDCYDLESITIPNSVTSIGSRAFDSCDSLTSITIPDSVTSIGEWAFQHCYNLKAVYCKPTTPPTAVPYYNNWNRVYSWGAFDSNASGRKIYVPRESVEVYKNAPYWSNYASDIEGYDF